MIETKASTVLGQRADSPGSKRRALSGSVSG